VQQVQLLDAGMAVRRIVRARGEPYEQAHAVLVCIRRQHFVAEAGRGFFPVPEKIPGKGVAILPM
jgi:hypothetical protein